MNSVAAVWSSFPFSQMVEPRKEANPRVVSGEDLKGLIKDSLRELLHQDPTLFWAGRKDATEPAIERTENTGKFSELFSGFPVISCRLESRLAGAFPPALAATRTGTAEAQPPRMVAGRRSVVSGATWWDGLGDAGRRECCRTGPQCCG